MDALTRRAYGYAAKFRAETVCYEPPVELMPTYENLARILGNCVRPPRPGEYVAIQRALADARHWAG